MDGARLISIKHGSEVKNIIIKNQKLKKTILKDYFGKVGNLTYNLNEQEFMLETDEQHFFLEPNIDIYFFNESKVKIEEFGFKKTTRYENILNELYIKKDLSGKVKKNKLNLEEICHKNNAKKKCLSAEKAFTTRNLYVGWRHRQNFESNYLHMGHPIAPVLKITLNGNEDYTVEELKHIMLSNYVKDENIYFFNNSVVAIGMLDGTLIDKFVNVNGEKCSFWEYAKSVLRSKSHNLKIYLLTTLLSGALNALKTNSSNINVANKVELEVQKKKIETATSNCTSNLLSTENTDKKQLYINNYSSYERDQRNLDKLRNDFHILKKNKFDTSLLDSNKNSSNKTIDAIDLTKISTSDDTINNTFNNHKPDDEKKKSLSSLEKNDFNNHANDSVSSPLFSKLTKANVGINKTSTLDQEKIFLTSEITKQKLHTNNKKTNEENKNLNAEALPFKVPLIVPQKIISLNSIPLISESNIQFFSDIIGKGGQGIVVKGKYLGSHVAIKSLTKGMHDKDIFKEIKLLEKVRHPNIIHIMAVCITITQIHIVMEWFYSNSLNEILFNSKIKKLYSLNILKRNKIAYDTCCAIAYLHLQKVPIIHRDIKPANVLINKDCVTKLCDLGLGKCKDLDVSLQSTVQGRFCGTLSFMAPEIFFTKKEATVHCDIWSLACTFMELYSEKFAWSFTKSSTFLYISMRECFTKKQIPCIDDIPEELKKEIRQCFEYNPLMRPNITELLNLFDSLPKYASF